MNSSTPNTSSSNNNNQQQFVFSIISISFHIRTCRDCLFYALYRMDRETRSSDPWTTKMRWFTRTTRCTTPSSTTAIPTPPSSLMNNPQGAIITKKKEAEKHECVLQSCYGGLSFSIQYMYYITFLIKDCVAFTVVLPFPYRYVRSM